MCRDNGDNWTTEVRYVNSIRRNSLWKKARLTKRRRHWDTDLTIKLPLDTINYEALHQTTCTGLKSCALKLSAYERHETAVKMSMLTVGLNQKLTRATKHNRCAYGQKLRRPYSWHLTVRPLLFTHGTVHKHSTQYSSLYNTFKIQEQYHSKLARNYALYAVDNCLPSIQKLARSKNCRVQGNTR